jgi:hypothetical protein
MTLTHAQLTIWILSPILMTAVALGMARKGLIREMPLFFAYIVFHILECIAATIAWNTSYIAYFNTYWAAEVIDALWTLVVIQEISGLVLLPYEALRSIGMKLFRVTLLALVAVAIIMAKDVGTFGVHKMVAALMTLQKSTQFIEAGMIIFLAVFSRLFGITWRNYIFGVALGFGAAACICGTALALRTRVPEPYSLWAEAVLPFGFTIGTVVWAYYIVMPSSSVEISSRQIDASPLSGWNRALEGMLKR